ncbi:MAG: electron transfer flavoprotein subunit alpha/FixB family protein [Propionibacteriaceae bacterium]|jgi:electron transfer flavoprotein alpha subunit|nr:electron transfer flavoprotein subunit alpha/FixB family protein [Propionibacteriaceae bacterium]
MTKIHVYASSPELAAEAITAAAAFGAQPALILTGNQNPADFAELGFSEIVHLTGANPLPECYAKQIATALRADDSQLFLVPGDLTGRDIAARVAGYLGCPMVSEAFDLAAGPDAIQASRLTYGGAVVQRQQITGRAVVSIAPGAFEAAAPSGAAAPVKTIDGGSDDRVTLVATHPKEQGAVDLTKADKVVCVGMGFSAKEELDTAYRLAKALGAEVGCTRPLAETNHWFPGYIGISGDQIAPKLYFSLGVSGQVQHTVGIRGAKLVVACSKDAAAPIFQNCDYGVVGDLFELTEALLPQLS